ncbi:EcsC family protein [Bacillus sp. FJAT-44742]|uniref:EcsC family protein n=1 Tax=Bacillus sp. FJAT-44742 TaxID=2014005 RepID=UPI000C233236|nr:EcsC family protein [Bacillus sp. FJAT-44742]
MTVYKYEQRAHDELESWLRKVKKPSSMSKKLTKTMQMKMNSYIPKKVHDSIGEAVRHMVNTALAGTEYGKKQEVILHASLEERERKLEETIAAYRRTAAAEGAGTGAGGILLGMADFPLLLGIKMRFLFSAAAIYGFDTSDYRERLYILHLFQTAFSSERKRLEVVDRLENWGEYIKDKPKELSLNDEVNWTEFQLEYRDFIDLPKTLQLIPGFGAIVGAAANYHFLDVLAETAKNGYRLRLLIEKEDPHK